jgi:hypothetical protein
MAVAPIGGDVARIQQAPATHGFGTIHRQIPPCMRIAARRHALCHVVDVSGSHTHCQYIPFIRYIMIEARLRQISRKINL